MDDRDLQLLRGFRADEAEPPAYLQSRIEERLWQSILAEEARKAGRRPRHRWAGLLRPAVAGGLAVMLAAVVAVVSDGGEGPGGISDSAVTTAGGGGLLDQTATSLFGSGSPTAADPIVGSIDLRKNDDDRTIVQGPEHAADGTLDANATDVVQSMPRDPAELVDVVRDSIDNLGYDDPADTMAFRTTIRWIVDPAVPTDLRAAMVRSLGRQHGIDEALLGVDSLGRQGIVIGHIDEQTGIRTQAVLDAGSGMLRELRSFTTTYVDPACPPGTFTEHAAYAEDGSWIDPARLPWLDWPVVVEACGAVSGG